ncbi:hypothetical protein B7463_g11428, partial [Scytalidium lignicola]
MSSGDSVVMAMLMVGDGWMGEGSEWKSWVVRVKAGMEEEKPWGGFASGKKVVVRPLQQKRECEPDRRQGARQLAAPAAVRTTTPTSTPTVSTTTTGRPRRHARFQPLAATGRNTVDSGQMDRPRHRWAGVLVGCAREETVEKASRGVPASWAATEPVRFGNKFIFWASRCQANPVCFRTVHRSQERHDYYGIVWYSREQLEAVLAWSRAGVSGLANFTMRATRATVLWDGDQPCKKSASDNDGYDYPSTFR